MRKTKKRGLSYSDIPAEVVFFGIVSIIMLGMIGLIVNFELKLAERPHYGVGQCYYSDHHGLEWWEDTNLGVVHVLAVGQRAYMVQHVWALSIPPESEIKEIAYSMLAETLPFTEVERDYSQQIPCPKRGYNIPHRLERINE